MEEIECPGRLHISVIIRATRRDSPVPNCLEDPRAPPPPHGVEPGAADTVPTAAQPLPLAGHRAAATPHGFQQALANIMKQPCAFKALFLTSR